MNSRNRLEVVSDREREFGRFLLTGSADVILLPKLSESFAGQIEVMTLWATAWETATFYGSAVIR
jgi:hypothetical protein